ncbi:MAG: hypothetical protein WD810_04980 [Solirubrobacterales bacterium]
MPRPGWKPRPLLGAVIATLALLVPSTATAAIYWTEAGNIVAARLDGSGIEPRFFQSAGSMSGPFYDLIATDTHLYWRGFLGVMSLSLDGPAAPPAPVITGINESGLLGGFGVGAGYLYWTNPERKSIGRAALDGSGRIDDLVTVGGFSRPCDVAVRGEYIYWTDFAGIGRARLDGSEVDDSFVPTLVGGCALAVDDRHIYWASSEGGIARATIAGDAVEPQFIPSAGRAESIAVLDGTVYWIDQREGMVNETIGRAVPGQPPVAAWVPTSTFSGGGVAVDARSEPAPRPLPSRPIRFGQLRQNKSRGIAAIDVWVPERGDLVVTSPAIGWKVLKGPEPPPYRFGSFRWRLKLWPGKTGRASRRVKRQLARRGRAPLALRVTYSETGQLPVVATKQLALRKDLPPGPARRDKQPARHHR